MPRLLLAAPGGSGSPPGERSEVMESIPPRTLYITLGLDGAFKAGTCAHCVVLERGRPHRAWDADGDRELDFERDTLLATLAELGVEIVARQSYICP